jgi:hypothetical protein
LWKRVNRDAVKDFARVGALRPQPRRCMVACHTDGAGNHAVCVSCGQRARDCRTRNCRAGVPLKLYEKASASDVGLRVGCVSRQPRPRAVSAATAVQSAAAGLPIAPAIGTARISATAASRFEATAAAQPAAADDQPANAVSDQARALDRGQNAQSAKPPIRRGWAPSFRRLSADALSSGHSRLATGGLPRFRGGTALPVTIQVRFALWPRNT